MQKTQFFGKTDMGCLRTNNEDNLIFQNIWDKNHILGVVIDGVGGYEGGEVAAEIAKNTIVEYLEKYPNGERLVLLAQAVTEANNRIFEQRQKQPKLSQMSCVLSAMLVEVSEKRINMVHIGDSRVYQFHNGILEKLSHDHSYVGYREDIGVISEEEAMNHPKRNEINRMLGDQLHQTDDSDFLEAKTFPLLPNSILLLCSDGLTDLVTKVEMSEILSQKISLVKKTQALIDKANNKGGKDNITVVLIQNGELKIENGELVEKNIENIEPTVTPIVNRKFKIVNYIWILGLILALLIGLCGGWLGKTYLPAENKQVMPADTINNQSDTINISKLPTYSFPLDSLNFNDTLKIKELFQQMNDTISKREQKIEKLKNVIKDLTKTE
jgi:serine/threonine protein phosphatase PrpC